MRFKRMPIEAESPEQFGYDRIKFNLAESSFRDMPFRDLGVDLSGLLVSYGDHRGHPGLRELLAAEHGVAPDDILLTAGAASALFIVASSILQPGDRALVVRPNYATNLETPRALGAALECLDLRFEEGYRLDLDALPRRLAAGARLLSVTNPHNPTGVMMSEAEIRALCALSDRAGATLLVDETYRDMAFGSRPPLAASLSPRTVSISSLSKTYGLPGVRVGWLVCRDPSLMEGFLAAKEQIFITGSLVDEEIAFQFLRRKGEFWPSIMSAIRERFAALERWIAGEPRLEWVPPQGGVVAFPRIREDSGVDAEAFHRILNERHGTFVGPGHWFEQPRRHMRIGYGWPTQAELEGGLAAVSAALGEARLPRRL